MTISLTAKVAAFCRQLGDDALRDLAREHKMAAEFDRAVAGIRAGEPDAAQLESDLDALDAMLADAIDQRLYPVSVREFESLPGADAGTGAQWWTCPQERCDGRGRVRPGQQPPVCGATGKHLVSRPLAR
jgi:hypothetical protein